MTQRARIRLWPAGHETRTSAISSRDRPDYSHGYNGFRGLVSNRYVTRYYRHQANESLSLRTLQPEAIQKLATNEMSRLSRIRKTALALTVAIAVYAYGTLTSNPPAGVILAAGLTLVALEAIALRKLNRGSYEATAADRLFFMIRNLERNVQFWSSNTGLRWNCAAGLEKVARDLERIPLELREVAASVRRKMLMDSQLKAQAMRDLEIQAIKPGAFTSSDMTNRLTQDLSIILEGRWYELPEAPYVHQVSRWLFALQLCGAFILIGAGITAITFTSKVGPGAATAATILFAIAVYVLNRVGVSTGVVERYARIGSDMTPDK
jgi:hypothetical protein